MPRTLIARNALRRRAVVPRMMQLPFSSSSCSFSSFSRRGSSTSYAMPRVKWLGAAAYEGWPRYSQERLLTLFLEHARLADSPSAELYRARMEQVFRNAGIHARIMALPPSCSSTASVSAPAPDVEASYTTSKDLLCQALSHTHKELFSQFQLHPQHVQHVITSSELPSCPPVDLEPMAASGLLHCTREPYAGLGCGGAPFVLTSAMRHPRACSIVQAVELPSRVWTTQFDSVLPAATRQSAHGNKEHEHRVINEVVVGALMGDAALSSLIVSEEHPLFHRHLGAVLVDSEAAVFPEGQGLVGTKVHACGTRMFLSPRIPSLVGPRVGPLLSRLLQRNDLTPQDIHHWVFHPGGPKVLQTVQTLYGLSEHQLRHSWSSLREQGNCMSASAFDVLRRTHAVAKKGDRGVLFGVGPGMYMGLVLLQWH